MTTARQGGARAGNNRIVARRPHGEHEQLRRLTGRDDVEPYLSDAAHYPGGHTAAVCFPRNEAQIAQVLAESKRVLPIGAQSSLTGGATPHGDVLLSTDRMTDIRTWSESTVTCGPGLLLAELDAELRERDRYYPPIPTYDGATVGGIVATNAAGAATFKYGSTRDWVVRLAVVLADGDVLDVRRGEVTADAAGTFEVETTGGRIVVVHVPGYAMPDVPKRSAGYYAAAGMDLIDLFIGSEGTLGVVAEVELRLVTPRPRTLCGFVPVRDDAAAIALVGDLREAARATWRTGDENGIDLAAVEYVDRRCLELLRDDGADRRAGFECPEDAGAAIIFQAELSAQAERDAVFDEIAKLDDPSVDTATLRLCRTLVAHDVFDAAVPVLPGEDARRAELFRLREAVPEAVNRRIREAQRTVDPGIAKSSGDVIVPFGKFGEALAEYRRILRDRGLDHAIWGHISDGNVHPNAIVASAGQMAAAREAQLEIGAAAIRFGGCPMSEHGVGRNPVKQQLLELLYGADGVDAMRAVKRALDPGSKLAPGVLFDEGAGR